MKRFAIALLVVSMWVLQPWAQTTKSFASTTFDSVVQPAETLMMQCYDYNATNWSTSRKYDLGESALEIFKGNYSPDNMPVILPTEQRYLDFLEDLDNRLHEGSGWATIQMTPHGGTLPFGIGLAVNTGSNQGAVFANDGQNSQPSLRALNANGYFINCHNGNNNQFKIYVGSIGVSQQDYSWADGTPIAVLAKDGSDHQPYVVDMAVTIPSDYEGKDVPLTKPPAKYVAMGDSFSSGEGNPQFEYKTNMDGINECHRSHVAYPRLLQNDSNLSLGSTDFTACSGATTGNILHGGQGDGSWGSIPQIDKLSPNVDVVTITIGGNDIGFGGVIKACADPGAEPQTLNREDRCALARQGVWDRLNNNELFEKVAVTLLRIDTETEASAKVRIAGYPNPFPTSHAVTCGWGPEWMALLGFIPDITNAERDDFEAITVEINLQIQEAAEVFPSTTEFVGVKEAFVGHDICSQSPWLNGFNPDHHEYSIHPNQQGHAQYFTSFKEKLQQ